MPDARERFGLAPLAVALGFLTRVPVGPRQPSATLFARAAVLFCLVGAALGALVGATAVALADAVPLLAAAAVALAVELVVTGALHVDGLADSADGCAGRDPEHALRIMRDHAVGAYGACALVLALLAKAAALAALAGQGALLPIVAAYAVSRAAPLPLAAWLPYARSTPGSGRLLVERLGRGQALAGIGLAAGIAVATTGAWACASVACLALVTVAVGVLAQRRLGGVTGDVLGAAIELTAVAALIAAAAWV